MARAARPGDGIAWAMMTRDDTDGEDDRVAAMARTFAQSGWPVALVRQAAEGAELAGYLEDRVFWERVADELDAIKTRSRFRVVSSLARRLATPAAIIGEPEQGKAAGRRVGDRDRAGVLVRPEPQAPLVHHCVPAVSRRAAVARTRRGSA